MRRRLSTVTVHAGGHRKSILASYGWETAAPLDEERQGREYRRRFRQDGVRSKWNIPKGSKDDILTWEEQMTKVVFP